MGNALYTFNLHSEIVVVAVYVCVCVCADSFFHSFVSYSIHQIRFDLILFLFLIQKLSNNNKNFIIQKNSGEKKGRKRSSQPKNQPATHILSAKRCTTTTEKRKKETSESFVCIAFNKKLGKAIFFHLKATTQYAYMYHSRTHTKIHHTYITHEKNHSQTVKTNLIEKSRN